MTVGRLIRRLQKYPPEMKIMLSVFGFNSEERCDSLCGDAKFRVYKADENTLIIHADDVDRCPD